MLVVADEKDGKRQCKDGYLSFCFASRRTSFAHQGEDSLHLCLRPRGHTLWALPKHIISSADTIESCRYLTLSLINIESLSRKSIDGSEFFLPEEFRAVDTPARKTFIVDT
jgi:hypothetical protein